MSTCNTLPTAPRPGIAVAGPSRNGGTTPCAGRVVAMLVMTAARRGFMSAQGRREGRRAADAGRPRTGCYPSVATPRVFGSSLDTRARLGQVRPHAGHAGARGRAATHATANLLVAGGRRR